MKIKIILLSLSLPMLLTAANLEFYEGYLYSELDARYSKNSAVANARNETVQKIETKIRWNIAPRIQLNGQAESEWMQFHWEKGKRHFMFSTLRADYSLSEVWKISLGSLQVNFADYIFFSEPWHRDIFRGAMVKYEDKYNLAEGFIANNTESYVSLRDDPRDFTNLAPRQFEYQYNFIDLGLNSEGERIRKPTVWAGVHFRKAFMRNNYFTPTIGVMYVHENYAKFDSSSNTAWVHQNDAVGFEGKAKVLNWADIEVFTAMMFNNYEEYDLSGPTSVRVNSVRSDMITASLGLRLFLHIPDLLGKILTYYDLSVQAEYLDLDPDYDPLYRKGTIFDERNSDDQQLLLAPMEFFNVRISQKLSRSLSIGWQYGEYLYRNVPQRISEYEIFLNFALNKKFRIGGSYYFDHAISKQFFDGRRWMERWSVKFESDILDNVFMTVGYSHNKDFNIDYDSFKIQLMMWGW